MMKQKAEPQTAPLALQDKIEGTSRNPSATDFSFFFYFSDIFVSTRNTRIGTPQSISSIRVKMRPTENQERSLKTGNFLQQFF